MEQITTIRELVRALLREPDPSEYGTVLERCNISARFLEPYYRWNGKHYTRSCIHRNANFELLVICYEPGQGTSIHDYDSQTAWIHPVMGEVIEERYTVNEQGLQLELEKHLSPGTPDVLREGSAIHRFVNPGPERSATLNLYAKPLSKWRVYDPGTGAPSIAVPGSAA